MIRVWDLAVRALHWTLAAAVLAAVYSGHWPPNDFEAVHHTAGYVAAAAVLLRWVWGGIGSRYARLRQFVRSPRAVLDYAQQLRWGREPRHIGHNPLGGWMVLALWATAAVLALTGFLYTTEWLWGYAWLARLHALLAWGLLALVIGHLGGVALMSWRHRENLIRAMLTGDKRSAEGHDVT